MIDFWAKKEVLEEEEKWIEMGLRAHKSNDNVTLKDIKRLIENDIVQLWRYKSPIGNGIVLTQVYVNEKELFIWLTAGENMAKWGNRMVEQLERFARTLRLKTLRAVAVPKMAHYLTGHCGFEVDAVHVEKEI